MAAGVIRFFAFEKMAATPPDHVANRANRAIPVVNEDGGRWVEAPPPDGLEGALSAPIPSSPL